MPPIQFKALKVARPFQNKMAVNEASSWIRQSARRIRLMRTWNQPLTGKQQACRLSMKMDACRKVIRHLCIYHLIRCLNAKARSSRVFWLTLMGKACQRKACAEVGKRPPEHLKPDLDWSLYGSVCYSHRRAILKALVKPMSPAEIKRWAKNRDSKLRMSANNVRDVIHFFKKRGLVEPVYERKRARPRYKLTKLGRQMRTLICHAERLP